MTLNELVISYKKKKDAQTLNKIFGLLSKVIHEKAKYVFYQQKFRAKKFSFKLVDVKKVEIEDVEQELNLFTLELIEKCEIKKPFDKYFYSSIWLWIPKFINRDFMNSLRNVSDLTEDDEGNETSLIENMTAIPKFDEPVDLDDLFLDLTDQERKLLNILKTNSNIKQSELADTFKVTQSRIAQMYESIRNKYKNG